MAAPWLNTAGLSEAVKNDTDFTNKCREIASDVKNRTVELLTLVERLGGVLTDVNPELRERGTRILALVLQYLPDEFVLESELHFIATFFCDRLNDHHSVVPAVLQGILAVARMKNFGNDEACRVVLAMFRHVHCQTQSQPDRHNIYQIVRIVMYRATKELQDLGPDFVFGVLSAMDGERDPRNLMLLFNTLPEFLRLFPPGHLAEDMFEVIACYFPIDFHSATTDAQSVTRDDLAAALSPCLTARPEFAVFCLPLLLEKLDSSLRVAKMDSLQTLASACRCFPVESLEQHRVDIWAQLKCEVLPGTDTELRELGLTALQALVCKFSTDHSQQLDQLLDNIMAAGRDALRHSDLSWFSPAVCLLVKTAQASPQGCKYVLNQAMPLLLAQCDQGLHHEQKASVLRAMTGILSVAARHNIVPTGPGILLGTYLGAGGEHTVLRTEALKGAAALARALEPEHRATLYEELCKRIHTEQDCAVREELGCCLKAIAKCYPDEVLDQIVSTELSVDEPSELDEVTLAHRVEMLCTLATLESFTSRIGPRVLSIVTESTSFANCNAGLQGLKKLVTEGDTKVHTFLHSNCGCLLRLVSWWIGGAKCGSSSGFFSQLSVLQDTAHILYHILRTLPASIQSDVIAEMLPLYFEPPPSSFQPLSATSPAAHTKCVLLLEGMVGALRPEVQVPRLADLCGHLGRLAMDSPDGETRQSAARSLAVLVNKAVDQAIVDNLLRGISTGGSCSPLVATWLTKALLLRGHPAAGDWMAALISLLGSTETGTDAAKGFLTLLDTAGDHLNTNSHCNVRILYKQRLFMSAPPLAAQARSAPEPVADNYHTALAHLLRGVPQDVLTVDISQTVSLLLECLQVNQVSLLEATLGTLSNLASMSQPELAQHLDRLVPRCLTLARSHSSMKVRIAALECLHHFTTYPTILLLPLKQDVVRGTAGCVDDRKRLVRRAATAARTRWFLIGSPGEPASTKR